MRLEKLWNKEFLLVEDFSTIQDFSNGLWIFLEIRNGNLLSHRKTLPRTTFFLEEMKIKNDQFETHCSKIHYYTCKIQKNIQCKIYTEADD